MSQLPIRSNTVSAHHADTSGRNKYLASLDAAWAEHLKPRQPNAPTVISTFAGGGGSSLDYSIAGFRELLAVEWDDNAVATLRLNFPEVPIHHGDICKLSVDDVLRLAGLKPGELDVFDGSPPCQGFSTAGKRNIDDPRNSLFREYARLLRGLQPKAFVMENVSGMVKGKMKLVFAECLKELKASGYKVKARLLNAMYFGVPQSRERMIFIGVRDDLGIEPSHPAGLSREIPVGPLFIGDGRRIAKESALRIIKSGRHRPLDPLRPSPTIQKRDGGLQNDGLYWRKGLDLTEVSSKERKRFASFPASYQFSGKSQDIAERIGNSVPPLFMCAVAKHVRGLIESSSPSDVSVPSVWP